MRSMRTASHLVFVLATQPACPYCQARPGELCADGNRVHLMRTVRIRAEVIASRAVTGAYRVSWQRPDGLWLRWVAHPGYPQHVFSESMQALPTGFEQDLAAWARIEVPLALAIERDLCHPLPTGRITDPGLCGTPGALPPHPLPVAV